MEQSKLAFKASECRCYIPLAMLGVVLLVSIAIALLTGPPIG